MGGTGTHKRAPRGDVIGWSSATSRRLTQKLYQVDAEALQGQGYAVTLTIHDTPADSETFHQLRRAWLKRLSRMGITQVHWVIEWQRRGTPHIHAAVYAPAPLSNRDRNLLAVHWLAVTEDYGSELSGQHIDEISGAVGWLKYLSKHASRGVNHYQRQGHPEGWNKTGRMWGFGGAWPMIEPVVLDGLNNREFYRARRIARAWAIADARKEKNWGRVAYLRKVGRPPSEHESRYRGFSEWIPADAGLRLIDFFEREEI